MHIKANELHGHQMALIKQYYDDKYAGFALVMNENGDWKGAEVLEVQVMNMRKKVLGREHPYTLLDMESLAGTYRSQGRWNKAEQLEVQVIDIRKKMLGEEHLDTLLGMASLAETNSNQERLNQAEQLQVQVMDMTKNCWVKNIHTLSQTCPI